MIDPKTTLSHESANNSTPLVMNNNNNNNNPMAATATAPAPATAWASSSASTEPVAVVDVAENAIDRNVYGMREMPPPGSSVTFPDVEAPIDYSDDSDDSDDSIGGGVPSPPPVSRSNNSSINNSNNRVTPQNADTPPVESHTAAAAASSLTEPITNAEGAGKTTDGAEVSPGQSLDSGIPEPLLVEEKENNKEEEEEEEEEETADPLPSSSSASAASAASSLPSSSSIGGDSLLTQSSKEGGSSPSSSSLGDSDSLTQAKLNALKELKRSLESRDTDDIENGRDSLHDVDQDLLDEICRELKRYDELSARKKLLETNNPIVEGFNLFKSMRELLSSIGRVSLRLYTHFKNHDNETTKANLYPIKLIKDGEAAKSLDDFKGKTTLESKDFQKIEVVISSNEYTGHSFDTRTFVNSFDQIYLPSATTDTIFSDIENFKSNMKQGSNVVLMAYGTSGTGKTYTFIGQKPDPIGNERSIMYRAFESLGNDENVRFKFCIIEFLEKIHVFAEEEDGKPKKVDITANPFEYLDYLEKSESISAKDAYKHVLKKIDQRVVEETVLNSESSRSHIMVAIEPQGMLVHSDDYDDDDDVIVDGHSNSSPHPKPKLFIFDLAGNENFLKLNPKLIKREDLTGTKTSVSIRTTINYIINLLTSSVIASKKAKGGLKISELVTYGVIPKVLAMVGLLALKQNDKPSAADQRHYSPSFVKHLNAMKDIPTRFYLYAFMSPYFKDIEKSYQNSENCLKMKQFNAATMTALEQFGLQFSPLMDALKAQAVKEPK